MRLHDVEVDRLVGAADVVRLARRAVGEHVADPAREVLHVDPVAHLLPVAVDGQRVAVQGVEHHQRDQLLRVLVGPVVVRAAADQRLEPVGVVVGGDEQVGARLGRRVGRGGLQRRLLGERALLDRAVDLVGGDLDVAHAVRARAASSSTNVPIACVVMNASGSEIERSTCVSAAKLTIASTPAIARVDRVGVLDPGAHEREARSVAQVREVLLAARRR